MLSVPSTVVADWINLTGAETAENIAEITVSDGHVFVALEIYPRDVDVLLPDGEIALEIIADGGKLTPEILLKEARTRIDRFSPYAGMVDPRTRRQIPGPPEDKNVTYLEVRYALSGRPQQLTVVPPVDESGVAQATIGFLLYHKAAPVVDFRYLSRAETLNLDWDDPWFTAFENRNLVRHHRWPQMTFLYIEPREVRHESLVRVRDLMEWTEESPAIHRNISEAEQEQLEIKAGEFFASRNPLSIEGVPAERSSYRAEFLEITPTGLQTRVSGAEVDASAALLGITESYWVDALPQTVTMEWQLFDERVDQVPTNMVDPAGPYPSFISADDPVLAWKNFLTDWREPKLRSVTADDGSWFDTTSMRMFMFGTPAEEVAVRIASELLRRTAIAYLERDPEMFMHAISMFLADPDRAGIIAELDQLFAVPTTGGGTAGVVAMSTPNIEELSEASTGEGFSVLANWQAEIKGQHWGHVDQRIIRFRALLDIGEIDGDWKLLDLTVLEARGAGS